MKPLLPQLWEFQNGRKLNQGEKGELLIIDNPNYKVVIAKYPHLKGVKVRDRDTKPQLPVYVMLRAGEYAKIKTGRRPHVGREGWERGWFVMSP